MNPFTFTDPKTDLDRFAKEAEQWKPAGLNTEFDLRLDYYLDRQLDDTLAQLKSRFKHSWQDMVPVTLPITSCFVNEQARVFLSDMVLDLVDAKGDAITDETLKAWWTKTKRDIGLAVRLKNVDRYTTLHRTCFLRFARIGKKLAAHVFFAQRVDAVFDPAYPMDLDMAYAVRLDVGSEAPSSVLGANGAPAVAGAKRYEFWCGRPESPLYAVIDSNGTVITAPTPNPYGAIVPIVMFTAHTEELGPFTLAKQGLHLFNRALNIAATDEQHIAESQGYGQLFITTKVGGTVPGTVVRGPNRAIVLAEGNEPSVLNGNAPISDLLKRIDASIKRAAVLHGIPAGSVSLEARAVASGVALQIEMRPLIESRTDSIEMYQGPVARVWAVLKAVHNATKQPGEKEIPEDVEMRWQPGEIQVPSDPHLTLDDNIVRIQNDLATRASVLAEERGISLEAAKKLADEIAIENAARRAAAAPVDDGLGAITAGARQALQTPGAQRRNGAAVE